MLSESHHQVFGRERFANFVSKWVRMSKLDDSEFCYLANFVAETKRLHTSTLMRLRMGNSKQCSVYAFEPLAKLAECSYNFHCSNINYARKRDGLPDDIRKLLRQVPPPTIDDRMVTIGDIVTLYLGYDLGIGSERNKSDEKSIALPKTWMEANDWDTVSIGNFDLGQAIRLAFDAMNPSGQTDFIDFFNQFMGCYPSQDQSYRKRISDLIMSKDKRLNPVEVRDEIPSVCIALSSMAAATATWEEKDLVALLDRQLAGV